MTNSKDYSAAKNNLLTVTSRPNAVMERGEGMYLYDTNGNKYLDFIGGWAVNCIGHSPKILVDALSQQAQLLINGSPSFFNAPMLEYAERITALAGLERVFFTSTGAEANESAIKLARKFGHKYKNNAYEIITTHNSFHGRTLTTMAATGKKHWEDLFEPKSKGFRKAEFNNLDSIKAQVNEKTCAIMLEPIQGEGGVNVATQEFMQGLRQLCDQENILLILDEVQTGIGRTGKMFGFEHYGIKPDILSLGKGIGGGFPLSAMLCKESLNIFDPGDQGGTYSGQPLAMTAGLAVLNAFEEDKILDNCNQQSQFLIEQLNLISKNYEINNIRGKGLLLAFDLTSDKASEIAKACMHKGLIINAAKAHSIRLIPPLIVSQTESEQMLEILISCLKEK